MTQQNSAAFNRCLEAFLSMEESAFKARQAIAEVKAVGSNAEKALQEKSLFGGIQEEPEDVTHRIEKASD